MFERLIVKDRIFLSIPPAEMFDEFGFKKAGCTTAAIVDITHKISLSLETIKYARRLLIDFSKAFDSVHHVILNNILKSLKISDNLIQWLVSILTDRTQFVKTDEKLSFTRVNCSIAQLCRVPEFDRLRL